MGYTEYTSYHDELCILSALGTAAGELPVKRESLAVAVAVAVAVAAAAAAAAAAAVRSSSSS